MKQTILPERFPNMTKDVYAGFGIRLAALLLDFVFLLPLIALSMYGQYQGYSTLFITSIVAIFAGLIYSVFLVKHYGGTPGKLVMGIKILAKNGDDINYQQAFMRYLVAFALSLSSIFLTISALSQIDPETYHSMGFFIRIGQPQQLSPTEFKLYSWISNSWYIIGLIVLLIDKRRRAVHDFIAGTVVVRTVHIEMIRNAMSVNEQTTEEPTEVL